MVVVLFSSASFLFLFWFTSVFSPAGSTTGASCRQSSRWHVAPSPPRRGRSSIASSVRSSSRNTRSLFVQVAFFIGSVLFFFSNSCIFFCLISSFCFIYFLWQSSSIYSLCHSSDALSGWLSTSYESRTAEFNREVLLATKYLQDLVPQFCQFLISLCKGVCFDEYIIVRFIPVLNLSYLVLFPCRFLLILWDSSTLDYLCSGWDIEEIMDTYVTSDSEYYFQLKQTTKYPKSIDFLKYLLRKTHDFGIGFRHLGTIFHVWWILCDWLVGIVRRHLIEVNKLFKEEFIDKITSLLLVECVARAIKNEIR
jgi:hypothetical protein